MEIEDVRKNTKLLIDNVPYNVDDLEFMKPGKGRAIYRLRLKNLNTGSTVDRTYHSSERVEEVHASNQENQYLYQEGDHYVFMDTKTFEQHSVAEADLGSKKGFLKEGMVVSMLMMGDKAIDITLPTFVELRVVESAIATKTATITPQMKSAVLETGCTIAVPPFIKEGDVLKVDTRTGKYVERISTGK